MNVHSEAATRIDSVDLLVAAAVALAFGYFCWIMSARGMAFFGLWSLRISIAHCGRRIAFALQESK